MKNNRLSLFFLLRNYHVFFFFGSELLSGELQMKKYFSRSIGLKNGILEQPWF